MLVENQTTYKSSPVWTSPYKGSNNNQPTTSRSIFIKSSGRFFFLLLCFSFMFVTVNHLAAQKNTPGAAVKTSSDSTLRRSGYVNIGSLKMYYEIHGKGEPLVLLHGGLMDISFWGPTLTMLAKTHEIIAFDMEGHGRTADLDRPFSWDQVSDDVATAITKLGYKQVDVMGYSLGAGVALRMGMKHATIVRKLVIVSGIYSPDGIYHSPDDAKPTEADFTGTPMEKEYKLVAPKPSHWPVLIEKTMHAFNDFKGWSESEVRAIKAPTMIIFGDNDVVKAEYEFQLFKMIGTSKSAEASSEPSANQMAVLPNTDHFSICVNANLLIPIINPFLDVPLPK